MPRLQGAPGRGARLRDWQLVRRIGSGGNGVVWLGKRDDGAQAAIKVMRLQARADRMARFTKEIEVLKLVGHERGVVPLIDCYSEGDATPWFAMPVAEPLLKRLGKAPAVEDVVRCIADLSVVLHRVATNCGVFHRDIKPENLFWLDGAWSLGDFGLAVRTDDLDSLTPTGARLGPTFYIAPEMLLDASRADAGPADVYSLAKCLWRLATGQNYPIPGEIHADEPQMRLGSWVSTPRIHLLDPVIEAATRHSPAQRLTMAQFSDELQTWLEPAALVPGTPGNLAALRRQIETATAPAARLHDEHMAQVRAMNDAVERLSAGPRSVEAEFREAGWGQVAVAPGGPEVIYNMPPIDDEMKMSFTAHSSGGFAVGISAPGGQPPYLYSGIGVQADRSGRQYMVAKHVITTDRFSRSGEVLWVDEAIVIPGTERAQEAEERLKSGLLVHLEGAVDKYRAVLEAQR